MGSTYDHSREGGVIILACDVASKCGLAEGEPGGVPQLSTEIFGRPGDEKFDAFGRAVKWAAGRVSREPKVGAVYMEESVFIKDGRTTFRVNQVLGGLRACVAGVFRARGIPVHDTSIRTVRACFLGKGNGNLPGDVAKELSMRRARQLGWNPEDLDQADAAAIWFWASGVHIEAAIARRLRPPSEHQGALL